MSDFSVLSHQRQRLLEEDYSPLRFPCVDAPKDVKPHGCELGSRYVLAWSNPTAILDEEGGSFRPPREPVWFIVVKAVRRHRKGGWVVFFDTVDRRHVSRFVRRTPPVITPGAPEHGDPSEDSSYTRSAWGAVDKLECVPKAWETAHSAERSKRDELLRLERVIADRMVRAKSRSKAKRVRREAA